MPEASPEHGPGNFPTTRWTVLAGARAADPEERRRSFETLVAAYWRPVYKHVRLRWGKEPEDAKDLTQGFFLRVMEKDFFAPYDPARSRFRTFVRTCLDGYLANERAAARAQKRGGGAPLLSLEYEMAEGELARGGPPSPDSIERVFETEWARSVFAIAVAALERECAAAGRAEHFALFRRYDLCDGEGERPTYEALAAEFGVPATTVTNRLALARREFRRIVLETLRELTATDEEFRQEARWLLGTDPA
jgi:RNA polymerase sigma factor (sigma-70 family)